MMIVNGENLYQFYAEANLLLNNHSVDLWDELKESERNAWDYVAKKIMGVK